MLRTARKRCPSAAPEHRPWLYCLLGRQVYQGDNPVETLKIVRRLLKVCAINPTASPNLLMDHYPWSRIALKCKVTRLLIGNSAALKKRRRALRLSDSIFWVSK